MGEREHTSLPALDINAQTKFGLGVDGYLMADVLRQQPTNRLRKLLYLDCNNVDFLKKKKYLIKLYSVLQKYVKLAKVEDNKRIKDIEEWLEKSDNVLKDAQSLENKILEETEQSLKCCPNWLCQFKLRMTVAKKSRDITQLLKNCSSSLDYWVPNSSTETRFIPSEPWNRAYDNIMEALKDNTVSIVALCGIGGVGKTTLAKEVGKRALELELFDEVVLVLLWDGVDDVKNQLRLAACLNLELTAGEDGAQKLRARLENIQSILIILDDVWEKPNLEKIGIPYGKDHGGCKILLTTSRRQVCSSMKRERAVELDVLDEEDAWSLFRNAIGLSNTDPADSDKVKAGKEVARECHGLPFLLLAAGRILKEKTVKKWKQKWETIKRSTIGVDAFYSLHRNFYQLKSKETKICLLLCSLFPKGSAIGVEDLLRYAIGLGLYQEVKPIEEVRCKVLQAIEELKTYYFLLECGGKNVEMNGLVHEYALLTASQGTDFSNIAYENDRYSMTIKPQVDLDKSPLYESSKHYTAIFVMARKTEEPPNNLVGPKLEILLFEENNCCYKISRAFLKATEPQRGLIPHHDDGLIKSLINLRTLHLEYCQHVELSSLEKLTNLKILSFRGSDIRRLPCEIGSLHNLRMLDLYDCQELQMFASDSKLIQKLSHLEELCIGGPNFKKWPFEVTSLDGTNASLSDLKSLPFLHLLSLDIPSLRNPKSMVFPRLQKYQIAINDSRFHHLYPISRALTVTGDFSLSAVWELFSNVQYLLLDNISGFRNLVPGSDIGGLNENMVDIVKEQPVPDFAFSELKELIIAKMSSLEKLCIGCPPKGFLQKLEKLTVRECAGIIFIGPALQSLEELRVKNCNMLQAVFHGPLHTNEEINTPLLSFLRYLELIELQGLLCVWKEPISHVSLQRLQKVLIKDCPSLTTLFSSSLAQSLEQLETLEIHGCPTLKQIFNEDGTSSDNQFQLQCLPKLTTLEIADCEALKYIFPITAASLPQIRELDSLTTLKIADCQALEYLFPISAAGLPQLRELDITGCKQLGYVFNVRDANVVKLPHLRRLAFKELTSLSTFSSGNFPVQLRVLRQLKMEACPYLTNFTISFEDTAQFRLEELYLSNVGDESCDTAILRRDMLSELEYLTIGNNEEIFQLQGGYFLSKLKKLILEKLSKLQVLWKDEMQIVTLQNLTYLKVFECNNLTSIFSSVLVQNLPQLTHLEVKACDNLEQIMSQSQTSSYSTIHLKSNRFPRLTDICIEDCNKLESLFPVSLACLPKLKKFMVTNASNLRQIFGHGNEETVSSTRKEDEKDVKSGEEEIVLQQLEELVLKKLPKLISFTPLGYYIVLPSLRALDVRQCGEMIMKFITYDSEPQHVRAQIEASLWPHQRDNLDRSMKRAEIKPEASGDIKWRGYGQH